MWDLGCRMKFGGRGSGLRVGGQRFRFRAKT